MWKKKAYVIIRFHYFVSLFEFYHLLSAEMRLEVYD